MPSIKVVLADDHDLVRSGLSNALTSLPGVIIAGEVGDGIELEKILASAHPDLLIMDVSMPDFEPFEAFRKMKKEYPEMKVLVVSAHNDESYVVGLLAEGVDGYHLKDQPLSDLTLAAQRVLAGYRWISSPLIDRLVRRKIAPAGTSMHIISRRQRELLRLLMQGCDNRKIARTLELSVKTVESHLTNLYRTLDVESRLGALNYVMNHPEVLAVSPQEIGEAQPVHESSLTVLLVDDSMRYRQQLGRLIGKTCATATMYEAEDINEALRIAEKIKPGLAFVDVVLGEEDGIQCTHRLKNSSPGTRVVLMSAYPDREFRRLGLAAGAVAFLDKKDLDVAAVRQVLEDVVQ
jgi:DNA-binding NarL/FixJ family response regulator